MRNFWIILIIVVLALIVVAARLKAIYDRTGIEVRPVGIGFQPVIDFFKDPINITKLLAGEEVPSFRVDFNIMVWNKNNITIPIRDLDLKIFSRGRLVAQRSDVTEGKVKIPANSFSEHEQSMEVFIRKEVGAAIKDIVVTGQPDLTYQARMKIYGVPFSWSDRVQIA